MPCWVIRGEAPRRDYTRRQTVNHSTPIGVGLCQNRRMVRGSRLMLVPIVAMLWAPRICPAQATGYTYLRLSPVPSIHFVEGFELNNDGDLALALEGSSGTVLSFVPRGGAAIAIAAANQAIGPTTLLYLRGLSDAETGLYRAGYAPTQPMSASIHTWNRSSLPLMLAAAPAGAVATLDPNPDLSPQGSVSFWWSGGGLYDVLRYGSSGFATLASCG